LLISGSCLFHLPFIDEVFDDSIIRMGDFAGGGGEATSSSRGKDGFDRQSCCLTRWTVPSHSVRALRTIRSAMTLVMKGFEESAGSSSRIIPGNAGAILHSTRQLDGQQICDRLSHTNRTRALDRDAI
jgi:hypothetical protein